MANLNVNTAMFSILTIFVIARAYALPTSNRIRKSVPQFISNNLDFDYDSNQPKPKEVTSVTSVIEQSTSNTENKDDNFIIYSSTSNRPSMSTPKGTSDSNMITTKVIENNEIDRKPTENESNVEALVTTAQDIATTQESVKNYAESSVETSVTEGQVPVTTEAPMKSVLEDNGPSVEPTIIKTEDIVPTQQSVKSVSEPMESNVEPMVTTKVEEIAPTQQSMESVPGHVELNVESSVTKGQDPISIEESFRTSSIADLEHEANPPIDQMESTKGIEATNAPVTTIIEDKEESLTTKPPTSGSSSCFNINPSSGNEKTGPKSCFPDLNLAEVYKDSVTDSATNFESLTENMQETTTIRLCGSCGNLDDVNNTKPIESAEKHDNPENHPTAAPDQSTTNIEDTILPTSTESFIRSEMTTVMNPMPLVTEMPSVPTKTTTIIQETMQPITDEMSQPIETTTMISQPNDLEMTSQSDPNGNSASFETTTTTIIDKTMPNKMSEINESKETTTIISQTTADPEMTSKHDLNSNASILTSYHVLKYSIILCFLIIFQRSSCCI